MSQISLKSSSLGRFPLEMHPFGRFITFSLALEPLSRHAVHASATAMLAQLRFLLCLPPLAPYGPTALEPTASVQRPFPLFLSSPLYGPLGLSSRLQAQRVAQLLQLLVAALRMRPLQPSAVLHRQLPLEAQRPPHADRAWPLRRRPRHVDLREVGLCPCPRHDALHHLKGQAKSSEEIKALVFTSPSPSSLPKRLSLRSLEVRSMPNTLKTRSHLL